ncbi:MAG: tetratricopeptide repeat protein [Myxococcota bacterium]
MSRAVLACCLLALGACRLGSAEASTAGETTVQTSQADESAGETAVAAANGLALVERSEALDDPASVLLDQLGYDGEPTPLEDRVQRWHGVGVRALRAGEPDRAVSAFAIVLDAAPEHASAAFHLGCALAARGEYDRAANAIAHAMLHEFPHLWRRYVEQPELAQLRDSDAHGRLVALHARLEVLHAQARSEGTPHTARWTRSDTERGAQAGLSLRGRFVPVAPRAWSSTAVAGATLAVDAVYDPAADVVVNVVARGGETLRDASVEVHDARRGGALGRYAASKVDTVEIVPRSGGAWVRETGSSWTDLRGRAVAADELEATIRVNASGIALR